MHRHVVIGTAGHIDHGKSELLKRITGTDPDRLKEEKERGMTTDLGFVFLGDDVTIIDVPGHERFVHNMLAGASTLDLVILVVAANDGVMPQTVEHFEITKLLGIKRGIVALTKVDLVEKEMVEVAVEDVENLIKGTYLEGAPIVPLSPITGEGIDVFLSKLQGLIDEVSEKEDRGIFRLWIDRCFTMKGFGLVVAGTVLSGKARVGEQLEIQPLGKIVRVRGLQVHNQSVKEVKTGERAAFNLQGLDRKEVERGYVLCQQGYFRPTKLISARMKILPSAPRPVKHRLTLLFHIGSSEAMARVITLERKEINPGEEGYVQLILDRPVTTDWGDRFVVRSVSPLTTVGGGKVIEANPGRIRRKNKKDVERLNFLEKGSLDRRIESVLLKEGMVPLKLDALSKKVRVEQEKVEQEIPKMLGERIIKINTEFIHATHLRSLISLLLGYLGEYHHNNPMGKGVKLKDLKSRFSDIDLTLLNYTIGHLLDTSEIEQDKDFIKIKGFKPEIKEQVLKLAKKIEDHYLANLFKPDKTADLINQFGEDVQPVIRFLLENGKLVKLSHDLIFHDRAIEEAKKIVYKIADEKNKIRVSDVRKNMKTSRKYALPLLQHLDRIGVTIKVGEIRKLKRSAPSG